MSDDNALRLADALERYRECIYDAAHARNDRERQALEVQADLCMKVVLELQEQVNLERERLGCC